jgi:hypothetical protein
VLGVLLGLAMLMRMQELGLGVALLLEAVLATIREQRFRSAVSWIKSGAVTLVIACATFVPQLIYWKCVYGEFFAVPQGAKYTRFGSPMIMELLYSARNGWFSTTPVAYAAVIGLLCAPRKLRQVALILFVVVAVQVYLNSTIMDWWGMSSWGARRMCNVTLPLVVGLSALLWRCGRVLRTLPRPCKHALAILVLGAMVAWNIRDIRELKAGKAAPDDLVPTCCSHAPHVVKAPVEWIFDHIGNPFEFPANVIFALRHGVQVQRWDIAVGTYPIVPPANALVDGSLWDQHGTWKLGYPDGEPYLIRGWSKSLSADGKSFRWTNARSAVALVPNLMPYNQRLSLLVAPGGASRVVVRWDGAEVASADLHTDWNHVTFDLPRVPVGEHELEIESDVGAMPSSPGGLPSPAGISTGVAVSRLEIQLLATE